MKTFRLCLFLFCIGGSPDCASAVQSIARVWNEQALAAIRIDTPHPPVQARNLFHLSVVMYDAWAAYTNVAVGYIYHGKATVADVAAARRETISYAAYRLLRERYALSRNATNTLAMLNAQMVALGFDTNNVSTNASTPAGLGNLVALTVSNYFILDGARQLQSYQDLPQGQGGYTPVNPPLVTGTNGTLLVDVNHWQPLAITNALDQTGVPTGPIQKFLGPQWLWVRPFALSRNVDGIPWIDPGPQPRIGGVGDAAFRADVVDLITKSSQMTPDDGVLMNISPGAFGNNSLGANDGTGHPVNPATGQPYASDVVKRGDFLRALAEFWADGPTSETPPGHWNTIANYIADYPGFQKRIGGTGAVVDDLEWDVKVYFALNGATHDAACAAWSLKRFYDGGRPIEYIRYMGQNGQSTYAFDTNGTAYHLTFHSDGLPIIPDLIEQVNPFTAQPGGRHESIPVNEIAIRTWTVPADPTHQAGGIKWIWSETWMPFQRATFVTPAFPGFISGHSTFSRAAAEVLTAITGSAFFPGGLGTFTVVSNSLTIERGPSQTVVMQWATYFDAADQAGQSRIYGGIHPSADDFAGRRAGAQCGQGAWALARQYFDGSIISNSVTLAIRALNPGQCEVRYQTVRGFYYKLQSATDLLLPFADEPGGFVQATDTLAIKVESPPVPRRFYRAVRALTP